MLEAVAHQIEFVAQRIDTERRVGRRAGELGDLLRPVLQFGCRFPEAVGFVHEVEPFAIGGNQAIKQALVLGGRQLFGVRRGATLDPSGFLLAPRLGQLLFRLGSGVERGRRFRRLDRLALGLCGKQVGYLRLTRAGKEQQRQGGNAGDLVGAAGGKVGNHGHGQSCRVVQSFARNQGIPAGSWSTGKHQSD